MDEEMNGRRHGWKMTSMEDDFSGRGPKLKTTSMEDNLIGRRPQYILMSNMTRFKRIIRMDLSV